MTFAEKLKSLRKQPGMSQEMLAEKLGVSRQAITKWETAAGIPDIENIKAISLLFDISIDELVMDQKRDVSASDFLFESVTEYDIDEPKRYDMKLGGAKRLVVAGYDGEKIKVRLASNTISSIQTDFKVKIDDVKKRIDVDLFRKNGMTEAVAKEELTIFVSIPSPYLGHIEVEINADTIEVSNIECEDIEFDAKARNLELTNVAGIVEVNCNLDMDVICHSLNGNVEINQISATSRIGVPEGTDFIAQCKGIATSISYEKNNVAVPAFCSEESDNLIELNGVKSELVIYTLQEV